MKGTRKVLVPALVFLFVTVFFLSQGWTGDRWYKDTAVSDEYAFFDLAIARPLGVAAGILGTGIFVVTLPFTIPTRSVDDSAKIFIVRPFKFSFVREFPDVNY